MKLRRLHKWKLEDSLSGLLFFSQRLDEMLFDYALDTYKPSALNPPFLCKEALKLLEDIEKNIINESSLYYVLDELKWAVRNDPVSKGLLDADIESYVYEKNTIQLQQQKIRLEVLQRTLEPHRYLDKCVELLRDAVISRKKKKIDTLARLLVTTLTNIGLSKPHLYNKVQEFFFFGNLPKITSADQIDDFLKSIYPTVHEFKLYFIVSSLVKEVSDSVKAFNIEILDDLPKEVKDVADKKDFRLKENEVYVEVKAIRSFDCCSAREEANSRLDTLKDLFTIFYHTSQITWREESLISQCCIDKPVIIGRPKNSMEKAFDLKPQKASKRLNWLIKNLALKFGGSFKKFNRIVDMHGICVENDVPENQLLNLWISLETLVPARVGKNKIKNVIISVKPFIRLTYIKKLLERFVSDLMLWNKNETRRILSKVPSTEGLALYIRAFYLLSLKGNKSIRDELYKLLGNYPLLRFRTFSLAESFKNPKKVQELLNSHDMKVAWQIRRIYRTRNLIVHSGRSPKHIGTLIENGHDYLDTILNEVVIVSCGDYKIETLEQAFELQQVLYNKYEKVLSGTKEFSDDNVSFLFHEHT